MTVNETYINKLLLTVVIIISRNIILNDITVNTKSGQRTHVVMQHQQILYTLYLQRSWAIVVYILATCVHFQHVLISQKSDNDALSITPIQKSKTSFVPNSKPTVFVLKLNQTLMFPQLCNYDWCHSDSSDMLQPSFPWPQNMSVRMCWTHLTFNL